MLKIAMMHRAVQASDLALDEGIVALAELSLLFANSGQQRALKIPPQKPVPERQPAFGIG